MPIEQEERVTDLFRVECWGQGFLVQEVTTLARFLHPDGTATGWKPERVEYRAGLRRMTRLGPDSFAFPGSVLEFSRVAGGPPRPNVGDSGSK